MTGVVNKKIPICVALLATLFFSLAPILALGAEKATDPTDIRAVYLAFPHIYNKSKIETLAKMVEKGGANGIVIDFKEGGLADPVKIAALVKRFEDLGAYTIARIVVFQDSPLARNRPEVALQNQDGTLWWSGRKSYNRYWVDPASLLVQYYNIGISKKAIDAGFDEIQFDYIRFPTDGNMSQLRYPVFKGVASDKERVLRQFFGRMKRELKAYSPDIKISADIFGDVMQFGKSATIGQNLSDMGHYFDVISPMAYPSHYACGSFGVADPSAHPYIVYYDTIARGKKILGTSTAVIIRPWLQDFTIGSIYGCGPTVPYTKALIQEQINASKALDARGFMLWNSGSNFTSGVFEI